MKDETTRQELGRNLITSPDQIPSLSNIALTLIQLVLDEALSAEEIAQHILLDPVLSSRILRASNSPLFGLRKPVSTVSRAVSLLGRKIIKNIILTSVIFETFKLGTTEGFKAFWKHMIGCALATEWFCSRDENLPDPEEGFLGGLFHDIGKLIVYSRYPHMMEEVLERLSEQSYTDQRAEAPFMVESKIWKVDHTIIGKWAMEKWNLPKPMVESVWLHHQPFLIDESTKSLPQVIRFADALCNIYGIGENYFLNSTYKLGCHLHYTNTFNTVRDFWNIDEKDIQDLLGYIYTKMGEYAQLFEIEAEKEETFISILCKANYALGRMHLKAEQDQARLLVLNTCIEAVARFLRMCASDPTLKTLVEATWQFISSVALVDELLLYLPVERTGKIHLYKQTKEGIVEKVYEPRNEAFDPYSTLMNHIPFVDEKEDLKNIFAHGGAVLKEPTQREKNEAASFLWAIPLFLSEAEGNHGGLICKASLEPDNKIDEPDLSFYFHKLSSIFPSMLALILSLENAGVREERLSAFSSKLGVLEERMIHQQRLALIGQLATGAAHEINNPLAVISVKAQMLERRLSEEDREKYINVILGQTERIAKITSDLMNFAKPTKPKRESARLRDIVDQVKSVISARVNLRDIQFLDHVPEHLPLIYVDVKQIEQVLINLLINARHAVKSGGMIEISAETSKNYIIVSVKDDGIGIRKEDLPKIFDPFFTTKTEGKGTGLGLPISQRIIEINGGKITVESVEGEGTTFRVWLPIDQGLVLGKLDKLQPVCPEGSGKIVRRILVVEDEKYLREELKENLSREDTHVDAVEDGLAAIDYLKKDHYDLAIIDLAMPGMNGAELVSWLKKNVPRLPIIVISAVASEEEVRKLYKLGIKEFLRKPFKIEDLLAIVKKIG